MKFYTNVAVWGDNILHRYIEDGKCHMERVPYKPSLFFSKPQATGGYTTVHGASVERIQYQSIGEAKRVVEKYADIDNFGVFGFTDFKYPFLSDVYPFCPVEFDAAALRTVYIDIETDTAGGFPEPSRADQAITAVTLFDGRKFYSLGTGKFAPHRNDVIYYEANDEIDLLRTFVLAWRKLDPDIVTGWAISKFDLPYLYNRITNVLGVEQANKLSPWGIVREKMQMYKGGEFMSYDVYGVAMMDYLEIYKKFSYTPQESYRLDYIAHAELGERKVSHSEYATFREFAQKDHQKFIQYNIKDVELVYRLEKKLKLLEMLVFMAYSARVNFVDTFSQVRTWDAIIFNYFRKKRIVIPPNKKSAKDSSYAGAYTKNVGAGVFEWVVSFDLNSLYPHLMAQYNISPETLLPSLFHGKPEMEDLLLQKFDTSGFVDAQATMAPNGHFFSTVKQGFLPAILERMYDDRVKYKTREKQAKKELEVVRRELKRRGQEPCHSD